MVARASAGAVRGTSPVPRPTAEDDLRAALAARDAEVAALTARCDELAAKLAACEVALGEVSEQLAAAQPVPPPRAGRPRG